jgi:ubiquinone/menaquinone biosynthesis C-methylase UbiE
MSKEQLVSFKDIFTKCNQRLKALEPWPSYYLRRYAEFCSFYNLLPQKKFQKSLEIGCGIGYQSLFIASFSEEVISSDLMDKGAKTHSMGLQKTIEFLEAYQSSGITVQPCTAEELPFADETLGFIYSSFSFQYIDDKKKALHEIARVMQKDGLFLCVLPTTALRLYSLIDYYPTMLRFVISRFLNRRKKQETNTTAPKPEATGSKSRWIKYLLPPVDKEGESFMHEIVNRRPSQWEALFAAEPELKIISARTTMLTPVSVFSVVSPKLASYIYSKTWKLDSYLGKFSFFKNLGYNLVIIAQKK